MVNVILKLTFVNNLVNFFAHALNTTVLTNLTDDVVAESALAELQILVNWLLRIRNDVLNIERSQLVPSRLHSLQGLSGSHFIIMSVHHLLLRARPHVRRLIVS